MHFQPASKKEIKRIAIGTGIGSGIMTAGMGILSLAGVGHFDYTVFIGAIGGSAIAILNFIILCLSIQNAVSVSDQKQRKAFLQGSYNGRLLLQAAWVVAALWVPHIHVFAATLPLLFPSLTILLYAKTR